MKILERNNFHRLFDVLKESGFDIIGPTLQDQAIVYDHLEGVEDLPEGWTDEQAPGNTVLKKKRQGPLWVCGRPHVLEKIFVSPRGRNCGPLKNRIPALRSRPSTLRSKRVSPKRWPFWACGPASWRPSPSRIKSFAAAASWIRIIKGAARTFSCRR